MILAIAWGLVFATIITLLLVPALYMIQLRLFKQNNVSNVKSQALKHDKVPG